MRPDDTVDAAPDTRAGRRSRGDLLDIAIDLADRFTPGSPVHHHAVSHVSLAAVADAAGVTRGALYRLWPTQQEFWNDLADVIAAGEMDAVEHHPGGSAAPGPMHLPSITRTGRDGHVADAAQELLLVDRSALPHVGVLGYPGASDPERPRAIARNATRIDRLSRLIDGELHAANSHPLDELTATDIATATAIIGRGLPITGRLANRWELMTDRSELATGPDSARGLLGIVLDGIGLELVHTRDIRPLAEQRPPSPWHPRRPTVGATNGHTDVTHRPTDTLPGRTGQSIGTDESQRQAGRRHDYLRIGAALAADPATAHDGLPRALGYLTLDRLARAASVTRRTLTNRWPDQASFRLDLLSHLLTRERRWIAGAIASTTEEGTGGPRPPAFTAFAQIGDQLHATLAEHRDGVSFLAYAPLLSATAVVERARNDHDALVDEIARELGLALEAAGRSPRRGVTLRQVALAVCMLADGSNLIIRSGDDDLIRADITHDGRQHTLTGLATAAVLTHLTEPVNSGRPTAAGLVALIS